MKLTTPTNSQLCQIPDGIAGTKATLIVMRDVTRQAKRNVQIRLLATQLVGHLNSGNSKNWIAEIKTLHRFVRDNIRYVKDIKNIETLQTPEKTLEFGHGDCDDKSTLLAALLEVIGHPARFAAVGFKPNDFNHVYVETKLGNKWIPLETTENVNVGWHPPNIKAKMVINI